MGCRGCGKRYGHAKGCPAKSAAAKKAAEARRRRDAECQKCSGLGYKRDYNTVGKCWIRIPCADCDKTGLRKDAGKNPFEVGDLLSGSWGYEQTNVDFYQVVAVSGTMVTIREVARYGYATGSMTEKVYPCKDKFIGEPLRKKVNRYGRVALESYRWLDKWDGAAEHASHYH